MLMKKAKLFLSALSLFMAVGVFAQNMRVTGTVTDASTGEAVPYASLMLKGTLNGTSSDAEGNYSINVPSDGVLVFSAVGYVTIEEDVDGRARIDVALEPDSEFLDETIVVAYGTAKKSSFTGSAGTVGGETISRRSVSNVTKALEGMVAGITVTSGSGQPGSSSGITIRGTGSINASSSPLYVVDGIPFDGTIASINPNDIASMTVLKDASAAALYGARAANGVIMITTKRGSEGRAVVNFRGQVGLQSRSVNRYDLVSQDQYVELTWEALKNNYYLNGGYSLDEAKSLASAQLGATLGGEYYNPYKNYTWATLIDPETGMIQPDAVSAWNEDWMDAITNKSAIRQDYNLSVSGGDEKTKYAFSVGYLDDKGVLTTTGFKRYSLRANVDHNVNEWMQLGASASYSYTDQASTSIEDGTYTSNAWYTAQFMAPIYPVYLKDANGADLLDDNGQKQYDYGDGTVGNNRPTASRFNTLGDLEENNYETLYDNSSVRAYAVLGGDNDSMGIFRGLSFTTNFGADIANRRVSTYTNPYHGDGLSTQGSIDKYSTRTFSYTWNQILKYERTFGDFHFLGQLGHEFYNYEYQYLYGGRTGVYPGIFELAPASDATSTNNSYSETYRIESYFGRLAADFADKYYLEATWRTDGSSRFHRDHRWGQFWSLGGSWRLSEEGFMEDASWVNNLTLRLSYGELGNDDILTSTGASNFYLWQSFYDLTYPNASLAGAVLSTLESTGISWETKGSWNVGLEGTFFDRLVDLTAEYYFSRTSDMLLSYPMAMSTGFTGYNANVGSMTNQGVEASIRVNWANKSNFRANSTLMGYFNRNKVTALTETDEITYGSQVVKVGMPIYTYYVSKVAGVDPANGQLLYYAYEKDENGEMVPGSEYVTSDETAANNSRYYVGSRQPLFQGSFGSEFYFGNFDFNFLTSFSVGGKVYDSVYATTMEPQYVGTNFSTNILRRWQKPGDVTDVPAVMLNSGRLAADRWLIDASYFAIKSVQLGYTLPARWTEKAGIQSLRIFATGDNIALFSKLNGMNPQYSTSGGTDFVYAPTRAISVGIDINF